MEGGRTVTRPGITVTSNGRPENNSFGAPHLASAGTAPSGLLTCTWKAENTLLCCAHCPQTPPPPSTTAEDLESRASKVRIFRRPRPSAVPYWLINSRLALPNQRDVNDFTRMASETSAPLSIRQLKSSRRYVLERKREANQNVGKRGRKMIRRVGFT